MTNAIRTLTTKAYLKAQNLIDPRRLIGYPKYRFFSRRGRYDRTRSRPFRGRYYQKHKVKHTAKPTAEPVRSLFDDQ